MPSPMFLWKLAQRLALRVEPSKNHGGKKQIQQWGD